MLQWVLPSMCLMATTRPGRPVVVGISAHSAELRWTVPSHAVAGFCISAQVGDADDWDIMVTDTHSKVGGAIVYGLQPETWYTFRVAPIDGVTGAGYGSAPSKPVRTRAVDPFAVQVQPKVMVAVRPAGGAPVSMGRTSAAAAVVARRTETTPPPTEEESASVSALLSRALQASSLRAELCDWDTNFETSHGRLPTDGERLGSAARLETLARYQALEAERRRLGETHLAELPLLCLAEPRRGAVHHGADCAADATVAVKSFAKPLGAHVIGLGGVMGIERRVLAARLSAEAHQRYASLLTSRCASLEVADGLSRLGGKHIEGAIHLFAGYDATVDGVLHLDEFRALYERIDELWQVRTARACKEASISS